MKPAPSAVQISDHVYWVGAIDWSIRDFHGYSIPRGTTYNAYLILADRVTLVDAVKDGFQDEMLARIASVVPPEKIKVIVSNHSEMDHTGCLPAVMDLLQPEQVFASAMGVKTLQDYFRIGDRITPIKENEPLDLGGAHLSFAEARMLHWPDSMITYLQEEQLLFTQDAFGMHLASTERFADEVDKSILAYESAKYFANILLPFAPRMGKFMEKLRGIAPEIRIIAPDHGPIWRRDVQWILDRYAAWSLRKPSHKAVIVFDTMWQSTSLMAQSLCAGLREGGAEACLMPLSESHRSDVATEMLDAGALLVGSPTLNGQIFPTVADVLTYLRGLQPRPQIGGAFGSYGWSSEAVDQVNLILKDMKIPELLAPIKARYRPDSAVLAQCHAAGLQVAARLRELEALHAEAKVSAT